MDLSQTAAIVFLVAAVPICGFVIFSDLARMKIPNLANGALVLAYAVLGLFVLPVDQYLWHWSHLIVLLIIGILMNAGGAMGAGDAKFIAAAGPYLSTTDTRFLIVLFCACLLAGFLAHRIARATPIRRAVPTWESWHAGGRFPMGFPLGMTLVFYLTAVAIGWI